MTKPKEPKTRVVKIAPRRFRFTGFQNEEGEEIAEMVAPAEYAVIKGEERLAVIVKTGDGWRVCQATEASRLGLAISPVGLDNFRRVKAWALGQFA